MKVVINGMGPTKFKGRPDEGFELWGLPWDTQYVNYDRLFEMHDIRLIEVESSRRPEGYIETLKECSVSLYMQEKYFPNVTAYPFNEMEIDYFNSSIAYMIALAIHEKAEFIGVYGVDMQANDEYFYQKPNVEYLLGLAKGKGIEIKLPSESPLLKFCGDGILFATQYPTYVGRYGRLG